MEGRDEHGMHLPGLERSEPSLAHSFAIRGPPYGIIGGAMEAGNGTERQRLSGEGATIAASWRAAIYATRFLDGDSTLGGRMERRRRLVWTALRRGKAKRICMTLCLDATTRRLAEAALASAALDGPASAQRGQLRLVSTHDEGEKTRRTLQTSEARQMANCAAEQVSKTLTILGPTDGRGRRALVVRTSKSWRESRKVHGTWCWHGRACHLMAWVLDGRCGCGAVGRGDAKG
jgi:hypothetical protein